MLFGTAMYIVGVECQIKAGGGCGLESSDNIYLIVFCC